MAGKRQTQAYGCHKGRETAKVGVWQCRKSQIFSDRGSDVKLREHSWRPHIGSDYYGHGFQVALGSLGTYPRH